MPAPALPIPWDDPARRGDTAGTPRDRTDARTVTGSSRTTTVNPRE